MPDRFDEMAAETLDGVSTIFRLTDSFTRQRHIDAIAAALRTVDADARKEATAAERERCALMVDGWHIKKGGYTELAFSIRQESQPPATVVHYAPYGRNANGKFDCGATDGGYTGQPSNVTCDGCKAKSPGLWPQPSKP